MAIALIDKAFLEEGLTDAHDDPALPLTFGQLGIVEPARIQCRHHAGNADRAEIHIDPHLDEMHAPAVHRVVALGR